MSDNPTYCTIYGECLILSRVLRPLHHKYEGKLIEYDGTSDKKHGQHSIFVIPDPRQIMPYCVIELQSWESLQKRLHSLACWYNGPSGPNPTICGFPWCMEMKNDVFVHMRSCDLMMNCAFEACSSMWTLMRHWEYCQIQDCHFCFDFRQFRAAENIYFPLMWLVKYPRSQN